MQQPDTISKNKVSLEEAKRLAQQFVKELEAEFKIKFIYWIDGSVARGQYKEGKSDIDLIVLPDESCNYGEIALRMVNKIEEYGDKYGRVKKKGRMISIIDPMIFLNTNSLQKWRAFYHEILEPTLENNMLKRIRIDKSKVEEFEKRWEIDNSSNIDK